jgi:lysozyme
VGVLARWKRRLKTLQADRRVLRAKHIAHPTRVTRSAIDQLDKRIAAARRVISRHTPVSELSDRGIELLAGFEGYRAHPYRDAVGAWTIGYGETSGVGPNTGPWTREYARRRLRVRANRDYLQPLLRLDRAYRIHLRQHEADALASLVYNLGVGILDADRTMGAALRSRNRKRIADAFLVYTNAGGQRLPGLVRRRQAERDLFLNRR